MHSFSWGRAGAAKLSGILSSLSIQPDLFLSHKGLGDVLCATREYDAAIAHYREAIRIRPDFKEAKANLTFALTRAGH